MEYRFFTRDVLRTVSRGQMEKLVQGLSTCGTCQISLLYELFSHGVMTGFFELHITINTEGVQYCIAVNLTSLDS